MAACLFARWCQENFFKYVREHYLDRLIEFGSEPIPDSTLVVNPQWRALDAQVRRHNDKLSRELASFAAISLPQGAERKAAGKHIQIKDLPPSDRFSASRHEKKHLLDTIKC